MNKNKSIVKLRSRKGQSLLHVIVINIIIKSNYNVSDNGLLSLLMNS